MPSGMRSVRVGVAHSCRDALTQAMEAFRAMLFALLGFAARRLPRSWAVGLGGAAQSLLVVSPLGMRARQVVRATFPAKKDEASVIAANWIGRPFRDHVIAARIASKRENISDWTVEMRGAPVLLDDSNQSFIIATGHFSREAMTALYLPHLIRHRLATIVAPMPRTKDALGLRVRLQMREMRRGIEVVRDGDVDIADVGGKSFLVRLLHHLRDPGGAVIIATDAAWGSHHTGGYTRPFAGFASQTFALGTARLARLSQRPIVTCVPFLDGDQRVIVDWGPVIPAPARDDSGADIRITNEILDWIERRIGERPDQYVLTFGQGRYWSPVAQCWVGGKDAPPAFSKPQAAPSTVKSEN